MTYLGIKIPTVFPAKAGIQIHPERHVGFTRAPTFAGETDEVWTMQDSWQTC
ncbi:hypothetical protein BH10PSE3_BH10PSE3_31430 [soil metagenome]